MEMLLKTLISLSIALSILLVSKEAAVALVEKISSPTLGLKLKLDESGEIIVQEVTPSSAAARAEVTSGEKVTAINGISLAGRSATTIEMKLRGPIGSYVNVSFSSNAKGQYTKQLKHLKSNNTPKPKVQSIKYNTTKKISIKSNRLQKTPAHSETKLNFLNYTSADNSFSLKVPDGWEVKRDNQTGKIEIYSFDDESLSILPFYLMGRSLSSVDATGLLKGLIKTYAPNTTYSDLKKTVNGNSIKVTSKKNGIKTAAVLVYKTVGNNTLGRFLVVQSPEGYSEHYSKVFTTILNSLSLRPVKTNNSSAPASSYSHQQSLAWTLFNDPKQGAFSVEVPQGWTTDGALEQPMAVDTRAWVRTVSPDQKAIVFIGDPKVPSFTLPTMQLTSLGFPPGSNYSPGYGFNTVVAYYMPAHKYVPKYGRQILKKLNLRNISLMGINNHPRLAHIWNKDKGVNLAYSASSCKFSCMSGSTPMVAYFLGSTRKDTHLWYMTVMTGILCSADRENLSTQVFLHMFKTFKMNPNWQQGQLNLTAKFSRMMFQNWREINQIMRDSYNYRSAIQDKTHRKVVNALRGTQDVVDPGTGTTYNVESGSNYHWLNNDGQTVLGTNQVIYPGANWTQLTNVP